MSNGEAGDGVTTTRHKVSKSCWMDADCRRSFVEQYEPGEMFLYTEAIPGDDVHLWAVFEIVE
jgi:hypothetical protein